MARLNETERLDTTDAHLAHWRDAETVLGSAIVLPDSTTVANLQTLRDSYHTLGVTIVDLDTNVAVNKRAQRDTRFGAAGDPAGVRYKLNQYKPTVLMLLGAGDPLSMTIPNLGAVTPGDYVDIIHKFMNHWRDVNADLVAAAKPPLTIGPFTLTNLQTVHDDLDQLDEEIDSIETAQLPRLRSQREVLMGDVIDELRAMTSIIAKLDAYHTVIANSHATQPFAGTVPPIFPGQPTALPRFNFNNRDLGGGNEKVWLVDPSLPNAAVLFLKEGATELTQAYSATPGSTNAFTFTGVTVVDGLDAMELRDATGRTIARGTKTGLGEV